MKIKIIENTNKKIFEYEVNCFVQQVKVINIQYSQTYIQYYKTHTLICQNDVLRTAMIIYELEGEE